MVGRAVEAGWHRWWMRACLPTFPTPSIPSIVQDFPETLHPPPTSLLLLFIPLEIERIERIEEALRRNGFQVSNLLPRLESRLEEDPFQDAVDGLAALLEAELSHDLTNLHLVGTALALDGLLDRFG